MHAIHGNGSSILDDVATLSSEGGLMDLRSQVQHAQSAANSSTCKRKNDAPADAPKEKRFKSDSVEPDTNVTTGNSPDVIAPQIAPESVAEVPATLMAASTAVEPDVLEVQPDAPMEENVAPDSKTTSLNATNDCIVSSRAGNLVFCPVHKVIESGAPLLDIDPYVTATPNTTARRMRWCAVVNFKAEYTLADAWLQLSESLKSEVNNYGMIMANALRGGQRR